MLTWLSGPLKQFTRETLLATDSACRRYFDPAVLQEIVGGQETGADRHQELWTLVIFEFWHRIFIEQRMSMTGRLAWGEPLPAQPPRPRVFLGALRFPRLFLGKVFSSPFFTLPAGGGWVAAERDNSKRNGIVEGRGGGGI